MNRLLKLAPVAFFACSVALVSCSDDDKDEPTVNPVGPTAENVFTNGIPVSVDGATVTTNEKGQVTKIADDYETTTFEYGSFTRAESFDAKMTITYNNDYDEKIVFYLRLNNQGFITYALEEYITKYGTDTETYEFKYDSDGHMIYAYSSDDEEKFTLTYVDGNLTKVVETEEDGDTRTTTFIYTNSEVKTPYDNKGNLMMFDDWNIDLDHIEIAYYAGLLGKPGKNLPLGYTEVKEGGNDDYTSTYEFHWEFNSNGFPTKFWEGDYSDYATIFVWK